MKCWGIHTVLNMSRCCPKSIRSRNNIQFFSNKLVSAIDMKQYGDTKIIHFGEGDKLGYTLMTLLTTSNITGHFAEESNAGFIDVFSCKDYDPRIVERVAREFFRPEKVETIVLERKFEMA